MIAAAVPIKWLSEAKSRLAPSLSMDERVDLVRRMLNRAVSALRDSGVVDRIALATPEPDLAKSLGVESVADAGDLNASLRGAVRWAQAARADGMLIVPADLPLITAEAIRRLVQEAAGRPGIVLARTQDGGTGALLLSPPGAIPPAFGPGSFKQHLALAAERGLSARQVTEGPLCFDLDTVEDLTVVQSYAGSV
jgi:2-phospho-L-lactate guanylyltransferase